MYRKLTQLLEKEKQPQPPACTKGGHIIHIIHNSNSCNLGYSDYLQVWTDSTCHQTIYPGSKFLGCLLRKHLSRSLYLHLIIMLRYHTDFNLHMSFLYRLQRKKKQITTSGNVRTLFFRNYIHLEQQGLWNKEFNYVPLS